MWTDVSVTLSLVEMMGVSAVTAESAYDITGEGYASGGDGLKDGKPAGEDPVLKLMGRVSMLCNDAELLHQEGTWKVEGDPTEGALYPFAAKIGLEREVALMASPRTDAIPFEPELKFIATLHSGAGGEEMLQAEGPPDGILEHCDRHQPQ